MDIVDLIIIVLLISSVVRGAGIGSIRQLMSTIGFLGGIFLGAWIEPRFVHFAHTAISRSWLTLGITLGVGFIFLGVGEYIGVLLKKKLLKYPADVVDSVSGSIVGGAMLLITVWLDAAVAKDEASVVKIEGDGCGGTVEGSGFIVSPGLVATNAHVVAGVTHPY